MPHLFVAVFILRFHEFSHLEVAVNKDSVVFCLVLAIPLFDLVLFGLCSVCFSLVCVVCVLMCFLVV